MKKLSYFFLFLIFTAVSFYFVGSTQFSNASTIRRHLTVDRIFTFSGSITPSCPFVVDQINTPQNITLGTPTASVAGTTWTVVTGDVSENIDPATQVDTFSYPITVSIPPSASSGTYTLNTRISGSWDCSASPSRSGFAQRSFTIIIPPPASCTLSFSPSTITAGSSTTGSWTSSGDADSQLPYSCTGNIGSGTLSASGSTSVSPTQTQSCTLTAVNDWGDGSTCGATVTVNPVAPPANPVSCSPNTQTVNTGGTASFSASGGTGTYSWSGGGSPATGNAATFSTVYSTAGSKTVTVSSGTQSASCLVTVNTPPAAPIYTLNIDAALYPNTNCTGTLGPMGADAGSVNYNLSTPTGATTHGVGSMSASSGTYSITGTAAVPSGYKYCSASSAVTFNSTQNQTLTVTGYFAPLPPVLTPTLTIAPPSTSACVSDTASYISWYDSDGPSGPAGNQNVTNSSAWSSSNTLVASVSNGVATGNKIGSVTISSVYSGITATALFTVKSCVAGTPDYSIQISPGLQNVQEPGSTSYSVTVSSINNYAGTVALSSSNFLSGISGSFSGGSSAVVPSGGSVVKTLNVSVADTAGIGRSTFRVTGNDGTISHFDQADIDVTAAPPVNPPCTGPSCGGGGGTSTPPGGGGTLSCTLDGNPKFGPAPLDVSFQISNVSGGSGNYQYSFDYGDGSSISYPAPNPSSHPYINQGNYTATGSVKDDIGDTGTCSNTISIQVEPSTPSGCTFTSSPSAVLYGQSSTLTWSCIPTDTARTCTITKVSDGSGVTTGTQSGSVKVKPAQSTVYNLHCDKNPTVQDTTAAIDVGFIPVIREIIPR